MSSLDVSALGNLVFEDIINQKCWSLFDIVHYGVVFRIILCLFDSFLVHFREVAPILFSKMLLFVR